MRRKSAGPDQRHDLVKGLSEPYFLPDPATVDATAIIDALTVRIAKLEEQVLAQYSALAAYATIAQQAVEVARAEARSDLDRSQSMLLRLVDQLRAEVVPHHHPDRDDALSVLSR